MSYQQIIHCRDSLTLGADYIKHFDVMITDPPYSEHVHKNAVSQSKVRGTRARDLGFAFLSVAARKRIADYSAAVRRWSVIYSDEIGAQWLRLACQARTVEYIRAIPWVRWSMPQMSGDRPPTGSETVLVVHPRGRKRWNGPGNLTHFDHLCLRGEKKHKAEKPLDQALDLVSFFSDIGESILDPFAGRGTIGVACRLLGRHYVGFEEDPVMAERARNRLMGDRFETDLVKDVERIVRWLERDSEPVAVQEEGPSLARAQARARDKDNVRRGVFL